LSAGPGWRLSPAEDLFACALVPSGALVAGGAIVIPVRSPLMITKSKSMAFLPL
jgi:hypothetical protein